MAKYLIQYDLSYADGQDYADLIEKLKKAKAVQATESVWYLAASETATEVGKYFRQFMHKDDVLAVDELKVTSNRTSFNLSPEALAWRKTHLNPPKATKK